VRTKLSIDTAFFISEFQNRNPEEEFQESIFPLCTLHLTMASGLSKQDA